MKIHAGVKMNNIQQQIIEAKEPYIAINASAAAGKTYCITERVKYLINNGIEPKDIVMITFTNMAAEEMAERIGEIGKGMYIGTIHSYINYLLLIGGVSTDKVLDDEKFDELFKLIEKHPECVKPIKHLLLDEAQDTDLLQWKTIFDILQPQQWTIVADTRQSIYGWRGAEPQNFIAIMNDPSVKIYNLIYNHRNGSNILNYAKRIISKSDSDLNDNSIAVSSNKGMVIECDYTIKNIIKYINEYDYEYGDWFILTRTNQQLEDIKVALTQHNIPCDSFKKSDLDLKQLNVKMKQNTVKVLTIHAAKGLESKAVIVVGAKFWNNEERRVNYVAATRAKELLIWTSTKKKQFYKKNYFNDTESWE